MLNKLFVWHGKDNQLFANIKNKSNFVVEKIGKRSRFVERWVVRLRQSAENTQQKFT